jgi:ABC-type phosphate/phosphonate transport system substrate-binding protein
MRVSNGERSRWPILFAFGLIVVFAPGAVHAQQGAPKVKIGLPANLFRDIPRATIDFLMPTFAKLMQAETGVHGEAILLAGPDEVGAQLADNKVQLAVFHGFEFAWAQNKHKELRPLVIAVSQNPTLTAEVVVAKDSSITRLEDLQGQKIAIPKGTREHARLFLARRTQRLGHRQEKFFAAITTPQTVAAALEDVANGRVQAIVVDGAALANYKWANPGKAAKLRTLVQSETFPTGVIAYREGGMSQADLKKFKDGLLGAHERADGQQLMQLWKMTKFEEIPVDYHQLLSNIVQAYPPPIGDEP